MVEDPEVRVVNPEQLDAECETYPTAVIWDGGLNVGVSDPAVVTVKAPDEGGQLDLTVPDPGVGAPLRASVPPQALVVAAVPASIVVAGVVSLVAATAAPLNGVTLIVWVSGLSLVVGDIWGATVSMR